RRGSAAGWDRRASVACGHPSVDCEMSAPVAPRAGQTVLAQQAPKLIIAELQGFCRTSLVLIALCQGLLQQSALEVVHLLAEIPGHWMPGLALGVLACTGSACLCLAQGPGVGRLRVLPGGTKGVQNDSIHRLPGISP